MLNNIRLNVVVVSPQPVDASIGFFLREAQDFAVNEEKCALFKNMRSRWNVEYIRLCERFVLARSVRNAQPREREK